MTMTLRELSLGALGILKRQVEEEISRRLNDAEQEEIKKGGMK